MKSIRKFVRANLSRILGSVVAAVAVLIFTASAGNAWETFVALTAYGLAHKILDLVGINPADSATGD